MLDGAVAARALVAMESTMLGQIRDEIRQDIDKVDTAIRAVNERVQHAVAITEQQLIDFNALLSVVREEAEHLFLSTASTMRSTSSSRTLDERPRCCS